LDLAPVVKELHGSASGEAAASPERCLDLFSDVESYPRWYPDVVRNVEVVSRNARGHPSRVRATLHVAVRPLSRDLALTLDVTCGPRTVRLVRVPHERSDQERFSVTWSVAPAGTGSRIDLALDAALDIPRLVPLPGGIGDTLAQGFVGAAVAEFS
jgi:ribosome-associated toxin RatA of RatAB toxin-antitoxin module